MRCAFATALGLPRGIKPPVVVSRRIVPIAARKSGGKKKAKTPRSKSAKQEPRTPLSSSSNEVRETTAAGSDPPLPLQDSFPGPLSPEFLGDAAQPPEAEVVPPVESQNASPGEGASAEISDIPVQNEARLKLPDLGPVSAKGVKRKRKPRAVPDSTQKEDGMIGARGDAQQDDAIMSEKEILPSNKVRELTAAYRSGGAGAEFVVDEIEKDPDYMLQIGNPKGEYDLTSAIIGTGRPNKQGLYVLPYLQSGHVLLLLVVLLCTFVYYPGFPLTELDDSVRLVLKQGLGITYAFNAALAFLAFKEAQRRGQPAAFWAFKTAFLGNLALDELKRNAPVLDEE